MKTHMRYLRRGLVLVLLLAALLGLTDRVLMPKFYYNNDFPTTATIQNFYRLEKNTVDVLFLGSSHAMSAFCPQEIYDVYGIRSYNLGTEQQNMVLSYYWLREALRFQSPQALVMDIRFLFDFEEALPLNSIESMIRKSMDYMRLSPVKWEAIRDICRIDPTYDMASFLFPNLRYHSRWTLLEENDFTWPSMEKHPANMGYTLLAGESKMKKYKPVAEDDEADSFPILPLMEEYMDRITALCSQKGITLVLVKTPSGDTGIEKHNAMKGYAASRGLPFYDFNEVGLYESLDYDLTRDNHDDGHLNFRGARKVSLEIGRLLAEEYGITGQEDAQWESSCQVYRETLENAQLRYVTEIKDYLRRLNRDRYTILLAVMDDAAGCMDQEIASLLQDLGLEAKVYAHYRSCYTAIVSPEGVREEVSPETLEIHGSFRKGACTYLLSSERHDYGQFCTILINGRDYAVNKRGLNLVIYDNDYKKVVDSVSFDTAIPEWTAKHKEL